MAAPAPAPAGPSAAELAAAVDAHYRGVQAWSAKYRRDRVDAAGGPRAIIDGRVWLSPPERMRWDVYTPGRPSRVAWSLLGNPRGLFAVDPATRAATPLPADGGEGSLHARAVLFLHGGAGLAALRPEYDRRFGTDEVVVRLTAAPGPDRTYVVIDGARVRSTILVAPDGTVDRFRFYEPDDDAAVRETWFDEPGP